MEDITNWLLDIELRASKLYSKAQKICENKQCDGNLSAFLSEMSKEEEQHYNLLKDIMSSEKIKEPQFTLVLDDYLRDAIENKMIAIEMDIETENSTIDQMMKSFIELELTEWNHIYHNIYCELEEATNNNDNICIDSQKLASMLQDHIDYMKAYFDHDESLKLYFEKMLSVPRIWDKHLLIVDDNPIIVELLSMVFSKKEYSTTTACNGSQALDIFSTEQYFDAIISDYEMPEMNGKEFFDKAIAIDPDIANRFVFVTGTMKDDFINFCINSKIPMVTKPFQMNELIRAVDSLFTPNSP